MTRQERPAARLVLLDESGRVLLLHVDDPMTAAPAFWITPGGGLNRGETFVEAAARELAEETGLNVTLEVLGAPIAVSHTDWDFRGEPFHSESWYFALETQAFDLDASGWDEVEREFHVGWHWWTTEELNAANEKIIPCQLVDLLRRLGEGAIDLPIELSGD
jgi:8-oxo-dGTP pyrophosphatase MutT (NUDIX family)